jgi:enoyl-CoA hydratase
MADTIYLERDGAIGWLVLNRPEKRNAITLAMWQALPGLLDEAAADPDIRVLVVRGSGGAFSAGADISEFEEHRLEPERARAYDEAAHAGEHDLATFVKPTIAMVRGACVGGGCELALACDLRLADTTSRFGITPAKIGLVYSLQATKRLVDIVGPATAKLVLFTGELLDATRAVKSGLVEEALAPEELEPRVRTLAGTIAARAQFSVRATKRIVQLVLEGQSHDTEETQRIADEAYRTADYQEGVRAFLEKRPPEFTYS